MSRRTLPPNRRVGPPRHGPVSAPAELDPRAYEDEGAPPEGKPAPRARRPIDRAKLVANARAAMGVVVTVGVAVACVFGMVRYTRTSPRFSIRTVDVHGAVRRTKDDVARTAGIDLGQNLFATNLDVARARLLADPWIERATLRRKLPGTLDLEIVEREAAAVVAVGGELVLVTRDGEPFKKLEQDDPYDLPVVTGIGESAFGADREGAIRDVKKALDLVADYERVGLASRLRPEEVRVGADGEMVLVVGREGIELHLGKGPFRTGLELGKRVLDEVAMRRAEARVVFLDNQARPERVVVRIR